jgi:lysine/ornithine N-monooxygenase
MRRMRSNSGNGQLSFIDDLVCLHAPSMGYGKSMVYFNGLMVHENGYRFLAVQEFFQ